MDPEFVDVHRVQGRNLYYGDGGIAFFMGVGVSSFLSATLLSEFKEAGWSTY